VFTKIEKYQIIIFKKEFFMSNSNKPFDPFIFWTSASITILFVLYGVFKGLNQYSRQENSNKIPGSVR